MKKLMCLFIAILFVTVFSNSLFALADLYCDPARLSLDKYLVNAGETFWITGYIQNNGDVSTGGFQVNFFASLRNDMLDFNPAVTTYIGEFYIASGVIAGTECSFVEDATLPGDFKSGIYYVWVSLDPKHEVTESNEDDNQSVCPIPFTDVESRELAGLPSNFKLAPNYPNPFNPSTNIEYSIAQPGQVVLNVYNMNGQEVAELVNEYQLPGNYRAIFKAQDDLPSGNYIYRLQAGDQVLKQKMLFLK